MSVFLQEKPKANSDKASYYSLRSEFSGHGGNSIGLYDPSQESKWTRLGLSWESFKRAPGTTGYVGTREPTKNELNISNIAV